MADSIVQQRISRMIHEHLAEILSRELVYVPGTLLTISHVRITPDLSLARVNVSTLPDNKLEETVVALNENSREVRYALSSRIRNKLRKMPDLRFYADESYQEADRINQLLKEVLGEEEEENS